jgi:hypothetical protein
VTGCTDANRGDVTEEKPQEDISEPEECMFEMLGWGHSLDDFFDLAHEHGESDDIIEGLGLDRIGL